MVPLAIGLPLEGFAVIYSLGEAKWVQMGLGLLG